MKFNKKKIKDLFLIKPNVFEDVRGAFRRSFCSKEMKKVGIDLRYVKEIFRKQKQIYNERISLSKTSSFEAKILTPVSGAIYNVVIDLRTDLKLLGICIF